MKYLSLALLALTACASDHTASKVNGEVGDVRLHAKSAVSGSIDYYKFGKTMLLGPHTVVAITGFGTECGDSEVRGHMLYLDLFSDPSQDESLVREPGTFAVWAPTDVSMGKIPSAPSVVASFTRYGTDGSGRIFMALKGEVTITSVNSDGIKGTFDLTFDAGHVTGVIESGICDEWTRSSALPGL